MENNDAHVCYAIDHQIAMCFYICDAPSTLDHRAASDQAIPT